MSRRAARTDANHAPIRDGLRGHGYVVHDTYGAGDGFPDLVVGTAGLNILLEIKDPSKPPSKRKLTDSQEDFHRDWEGQVNVVHTLDEALNVIYDHLTMAGRLEYFKFDRTRQTG